MLKWQSLLPYSIPKENRRHVIRNVRKFLDGALVGTVAVEAVGSAGVQITSSTTGADLIFVVTANQLPRNACIMLVATRGTEPPAKTILELSVSAAGGGDGTPGVGPPGVTGVTGVSGQDGASIVGATGVTGVSGQGEQGVTGVTGVSGQSTQGEQGVTGVTGVSGQDGASIVGATGVTGVSGQGEQGVTGVTGVSGQGATRCNRR